MTLYARSDICAVTVSADHGGCATVHSRPVESGAPAKVWALDCDSCESHLRHDPLWSTTLSEIPETHDEALARKDFEKRGAMDKDALMAMALARLTGLDLPETLAAKVGGVRQHIASATCPAGHPNTASAKFCTECGSPVRAPGPQTCPEGHESPPGAKFCTECGKPAGEAGVPPAATDAPRSWLERELATGKPAATEDAPAPAPEPVPQPDVSALPSNTKMRGMKAPELVKLARKAGLDASGTREQVLNRLIAARNAAA